jgi:predicted Zn-dependent peptidase
MLLIAGCGHRTPDPAPASELLAAVDIPYEQFELDNGLRVLVHTDRKAPIVAVSVWYGVGSKHEPAGKTGFAHLFEHLMFNGSENVPGDFFEPLERVGATNVNGTTWFDRTNYFESVPTPALDVALFMESDRMGHLLGAVTQKVLDNQRGVVQNEKRQGDNDPYGLVEYAEIAALLPPDHPYGHSTIGSMADLDAATLADVKNWFVDHYGPNNAIVVLAGDIDAATARPLMQEYFGDIPRGKPVPRLDVPVPTLAEAKTQTMKDHVATPRLYREWTAPGINDAEAVPLSIGMSVLGGLSSSRLDNILVRQEQLAVSVSASYGDFAQLGFLTVTADLKPGVDQDKLARRLDEIIAQYIKDGPTADEVQRAVVRNISGAIAGLESVGGFSGKAPTLAEGLLYSDDPAFYKKRLASATPEQVRAALQKWMTRPVYALQVVPGERDAYEEAKGVGARPAARGRSPAYYRAPGEPERSPLSAVDRSKMPQGDGSVELHYPAVETGQLSNGVKVHLARRDNLPILRMSVNFDAGNAADPRDKLGAQSLMLGLLTEGTTTRDSIAIAEEEERLGANLSAGATLDSTRVQMYALTPNLARSLDLLADVIRNPAFAPDELERLRARQLTRIASEMTEPEALAMRTLPPLIYGPGHPYGIPFGGSGNVESVKALSRDDMVAFHQRWIRPDNAEIFAVGDTTLDELLKLLEPRFGKAWAIPAVDKGTKDFNQPIPAARQRIVLVDRPGSPQSLIIGGEVLDRRGTDDYVALLAGNEVLGGGFMSRMNMDLRETKGWSYGVNSSAMVFTDRYPFVVYAPVQADRTGESIRALKQHLVSFTGSKGVTPDELARTISGRIRELPGNFETSSAVLNQMQTDAQFGRPFDYPTTLPQRYRAMDARALDDAVRSAVNPDGLTWVVVGDKARVLPQLKPLGMEITVVEAAHD